MMQASQLEKEWMAVVDLQAVRKSPLLLASEEEAYLFKSVLIQWARTIAIPKGLGLAKRRKPTTIVPSKKIRT